MLQLLVAFVKVMANVAHGVTSTTATMQATRIHLHVMFLVGS